MTFERVDGVLVEQIGESWAAFSPLSRQTSLLSDLAAAVLEVLDAGPLTFDQVAQQLAADSGRPRSELDPVLLPCWDTLVGVGLIRKQP